MAIDISSFTWAAVKEVCSQGIVDERNALEGLGCTEKRADQARGAIHAYSQILALGTPAEAPREPSKRTDRAGF